MKLSSRLKAIVDFVSKDSIVADVGTDHGYIPKYLIEQNISKLVIASDVSQGSLNKTINYIDELKLSNRIYSRLGDGLDILKPYEVDTVIIAGMGGLLIKDILEKNEAVTNSINNFILQPMIASRELREYLVNNSFKIIDEDLVLEDNKYYEIIYAKKGKDIIEKDIYYEISDKLVKKKHPLLKQFIQNKISSAEYILENLEGKDSEKSKFRYSELINLIEEYKEVLLIEG